MHNDDFRSDDDLAEESDAPFETDDEGNVVEPEDDEDDLEKHGFTEEEADSF